MSLPHPARGGVVAATAYNKLFLGAEYKTQRYTIEAGQVLAMGSVLGRKSADGKLKLSAAAAGDGSEVPMAVLQEPIDTSATGYNRDVSMSVVIMAKVNSEGLVYGAGHTADTVKEPLRDAGFQVETMVYSEG